MITRSESPEIGEINQHYNGQEDHCKRNGADESNSFFYDKTRTTLTYTSDMNSSDVMTRNKGYKGFLL